MKTGLVIEGGGRKCVYSAGVLDAFLAAGISFDYVIGVSAGSGNAASYLAGQKGRNLRFYADYSQDSEYFGLSSVLNEGSLLGLEYIYGTLTNSDGKDPLDYPAMMANPTEFEIPATDVETGRVKYFNKLDISENDYRVFAASCAVPVMANPIQIGGQAYFDGGLADPIPVQRAIDQGCDRIVIILSKDREYVRKPQKAMRLIKNSLKEYPIIAKAIAKRHLPYNKLFAKILAMENKGEVFVFAPDQESLQLSLITKPEEIQALYDRGYEDFFRQEDELKKFLS